MRELRQRIAPGQRGEPPTFGSTETVEIRRQSPPRDRFVRLTADFSVVPELSEQKREFGVCHPGALSRRDGV